MISLPTSQVFPEAATCFECRSRLQELLSRLEPIEQVRIGERETHVSSRLDPTSLENFLDNHHSNLIKQIEKHHKHAIYTVEGMDCPACSSKIENSVGKITGIQATYANFSSSKLTIQYDPTNFDPKKLNKALISLGYKIKKEGSTTPWWQKSNGRLVITSGILLLSAFIFSYIEPNLANFGYIAATLIAIWPLLKKVWASRQSNPFGINTLVSLAALGAIFIGEAAEGSLVVFLFAVGEVLEGIAAGRARAGIKALVKLTPKTAFLLEQGNIREVDSDNLQIGQIIRVLPGSRLPTDGTIVAGTAHLNQSAINGESTPIFRDIGQTVFAGSINLDAVIEVRVEKEAKNNTISQITRLIESAQGSKAPTARFIDRFSRFYTPIVLLIAILIAFVPPLFVGNWIDWFYKGISLLLIGCPCALVLSVPAAITSALASAARRGLLIKSGAALEMLGQVKTIAFDKTGTLTQGKPVVSELVPFGISADELLHLAAAIEQGSNHPLAQAILQKAAEENISLPTISEAKTIAGQGVEAIVEGQKLRLLAPRFAQINGFEKEIQTLEQAGKTVVVLVGEKPLGLLALRDQPRPEAAETVQKLKNLGLKPLMLTGDNARTGQAIAQELGLEAKSELLPWQKLEIIDQLKKAQLKNEQKNSGKTAMVGDGINDGPALAKADVGISMGQGTELALETADVALLKNSLFGISDLIVLSRTTALNIKQNIALALGLKALFLVGILLGFTTLWLAILADTGATVLVTANALRLLRFGRNKNVVQKGAQN